MWEFDARGLMRRREASINDLPIADSDRKFFWPAPGPRPPDHPGIPDNLWLDVAGPEKPFREMLHENGRGD
jgi:hypothetical protein